MQTTCYPRHPTKIADWHPPEPAALQLVLPLATNRRGDWHYDGLPRPARINWAAVLLSAGLHGLLLWNFGHRPARPQVVAMHTEPVIQLVMPPLDDDDEPPPRNLEEMEETPGVVVPKLADLPTTVVLSDAFVQPLEMNIPLQTNFDKGSLTSIPLKIATSSQRLSGLKDIFELAQLDRVPEPIAQPAPQFPFELIKLIERSEVRVEFIVDTNGVPRGVRVVSSTHKGFEQASIDGVSRWRFRPGLKAGKKVNTRMMVPIVFMVTDPD